MNFMGGSSRGGGGGGFNYEEDPRGGGRTHPFSQSSSTSSSPNSSQQIGQMFPLSSYHHQHLQQQQQQQNRWNGLELMMDSSSSPTTNFNNGGGDDNDSSEDHNNLLLRPQGGGVVVGESSSEMAVEREHMFDKVVTPSDVGKLNRLVIPKQHAEKYFPLDSSTNEKGLLLNFEDRNGKPWRFRYSYWNSSQSYVMTKGWSRFVKEKKLDAGDVVSFQRGLGELAKDRLFIDWRRRPDAPDHLHHHSHLSHHHLPPQIPSLSLPHHHLSFHPWNHPYYMQVPPREAASHHHQAAFLANQSHYKSYATYNTGAVMNGNPCSGSVLYLRSAPAPAPSPIPQQMQFQRGSSTNEEAMVYESVPVVQGKAAAKRLRLFGVNMDCPISESDDQCDINILPSTVAAKPQSAGGGGHSSVNIPTLQMRPYSGTPVDLLNKGKSSMSLDFYDDDDDVSRMD